jgi:ComF family protein
MTYPTIDAVGTRRAYVSQWLRRGLDLLFPPRCVACSRTGSWFCADCLATVEALPAPHCPRCGRPARAEALCSRCRTSPTELDGSRSVALHSGALREAIHHFKYQSRRELAVPLGNMLYDYWRHVRVPIDLVVPVPLHPHRQRERGFNQSHLLSEVFAAQAALPLNATDLVRTRATVPQVGLGADERKTNVAGAFDWTGEQLDGERVLLIDDVCTSGATLEACAQALRQGGAGTIWALTLARPLHP